MIPRPTAVALLPLCLLFLPAAGLAEDVLSLCEFETRADLRDWNIKAGRPELTTEGATSGEKALQITLDPKGKWDAAHLSWRRVKRDWSEFDALVLDVFNPMDRPIVAAVLVADRAWEDKGRTYWNRHNGEVTIPPGPYRWVVPGQGSSST